MCVSPDVPVEVAGGTATVYLDRPDAGNRVSERLATGIRDAFDTLERDDRVRVVVIAGRGEAFCLGSDPPADEPDFSQTADRLRISSRIAACAKPVIAALNGDALDQGLEIALACDFRLASEDARLGLTQVGAGLLPWDGGTQRLPRLDRPGPGDGDGPDLARPSARGKRWRWALWTCSPGETRS